MNEGKTGKQETKGDQEVTVERKEYWTGVKDREEKITEERKEC